jgi:hypothetical protein
MFKNCSRNALVAICTVALGMASLSPASAQVVPIEQYLASVQEKANNVINNAGAQGRSIAMEAGQAAINAVASFRAFYGDSVRDTSQAATLQQTQLFKNIQTAAQQLDAFMRDSTTNLQGVANTLAVSVANLPLGKNTPRVTKVSPIFRVSTDQSDLVIGGVLLSNNRPSLMVDGKAVSPKTTTDTELRFAMPSINISTATPLLKRMTLTLFEKSTYWLVFSKYIPHEYPVTVTVYPTTLGTYSIVPRRRVTTTETRTIQSPGYRCESPHGEGGTSVPVHVVPTEGWQMDINSIKYNRSYSNHGSITMGTTSSAGFTATMSCYGFGIVKDPVFGKVIDAGSVGVEQGTFSFAESRQRTELTDGTPLTGTIKWANTESRTDLPGDTETAVVKIKLFDGQTVATDGSGETTFASIGFNPASKLVTISPKRIDDAFRR